MELTYKPPYNFKEGALLLIDKPYEWMSFGLVKKVRNTVNEKVGHAGTLDPLASGLMILCTGKYTKKLTHLTGMDKTYTGTFKLGSTTPSYDRETEEVGSVDLSEITQNRLNQIAQTFLGKQDQLPPMFSAIKQKGKKLYELAREGKEVERPPRAVEIMKFELTKIDLPFIYFEVSCSKGTYIRSLAHDFGEKLGVGAYLYDLRRTKIGEYSIEEAWKIEDFVDHVKKSDAGNHKS